MAQTIKLKRSSTQGKVPTTSQLALGEIAINTYDGRIFFEKNDGSATIEHIVTTDSITTGSITLTGTVTAGTLTTTGTLTAASLDISGDIDIDGTTNLDVVDIDGATQIGNTLTVGSSINAYDVKFFGDTSNQYLLWDASADKLILTGETQTNTLTLSGLSADATLSTSLMIDGSGVVGTRELGSNAFNSTSFGTGSVTSVSVGTGLDVSTATTVPNITLDLSELTDMTGDVVGSQDELILLDNGAERRKAIDEIKLSQFNNDSGFVTTTGSNADTVDNLHASSFIRSDANDTATGDITFEGAIEMDQGLKVGANILPQTDNVAEVGTAALTFNNGRFTNFTVDSTLSVRGAIDLADDDEIQLGSGDDFIIVDNGTDTLFKSTRHGGEVYFQNENASGTNQNTLILGTDTSYTDRTYVELRYNNVERIRTTVDGSRLAGVVNFDGTTQSTSKTTGTVIIDGGVGIAKTLNVGEDVVAYASSDERYKDLITPIENPNEKIKLLSGNTFVWNDKHEVFKGKKDIGVIAQEVEKVLPEIVETRENGYKAVKYEKIVALLIESNKELIKRVEELESKIK